MLKNVHLIWLTMSSTKSPQTSQNASISTISHRTPPSYLTAVITDSEDILREIFLKLSIKSLIRFKSVFKHWLSLISDPNFHRRHKDFDNPISGLVLKSSRENNEEFDQVNLDRSSNSSQQPSFRSHDFGNSNIRILQSCNGLLLCSRVHLEDNFVCNPTTKEYTILPPLPSENSVPNRTSISGLNLAFEPRVSSYYQVVCMRYSDSGRDHHYQIEIYSSETNHLRPSGDPFFVNRCFSFDDGVFLNGCIYWPNYWCKSMYFNLRDEQMMRMPMPAISNYRYRYFGESRGHLHLLTFTNKPRPPHLEVFEMETDCSGWFVTFRLNLIWMICQVSHKIVRESFHGSFYCSPLCVVRGELDELSYIVLEVPGAILQGSNYRKYL